MVRAIDESSRAATQLLDHAMIVFRAKQLEYQDIELVELVSDLVMRVTPLAEIKEIEMCLKGDAVVMVSGDPILVQIAIRNILDNALKYSPAESVVSIIIRAKPSPFIEVKDQGNGFPIDEMDSLTNRFVRGSNIGTAVGSGLGLTIARDVANAHGGQISISNSIEGGACVQYLF